MLIITILANGIDLNNILKSTAIVLILVLVAGAVTYFWIDNDSVQSATNPDISSSINLLQIYIVVFTIGISIMGFIGYKSMRELTEETAKRTAENIIETQIEKIISDASDKAVPLLLEEFKLEIRNRDADIHSIKTTLNLTGGEDSDKSNS